MTNNTTSDISTTKLGEKPYFDLVHISGIVCLSTSAICSTIVICLTLFWKPRANTPRLFFKLPIGERLIFHLAIISVLYCCSHGADHMYILISRDFPPDAVCTGFGFVVMIFAVAYQNMNLLIALNAFAMVVMQWKFGMGKYDWKLICACVGPAFAWSVALLASGHMGQSNDWCLVDQRREYGYLFTNMIGSVIITTFFVMVVCYCSIWYKIKKSSTGLLNSGLDANYRRSVRTMMLTVLLYFVQKFSYVIYSIWIFIEAPPTWLVWAIVTSSNMCGVCILVIYMRMRYLKQNKVLGVTTTTAREKQRDKTAATKRENIKGTGDEKSKIENGNGVEMKNGKEAEKIKEAMKGHKYEINTEHDINLESVTAI